MTVYDWKRPARELFEALAHESVSYWNAPYSKRSALALLEAQDRLCAAARVREARFVAMDLARKLGGSAYGTTPGDARQIAFNLPDGVSLREVLDLVVEFRYSAAAEDSGPTGAAAKESREDIAAPGGATSNPCSVPEAEPARQLRDMGSMRDARRARFGCPCGASFPTTDELIDHQVRCPRTPNGDPDPCGCEEAEALKARLRTVTSLVSKAPSFDPGGEGPTLGQCDTAFAVLGELRALLGLG